MSNKSFLLLPPCYNQHITKTHTRGTTVEDTDKLMSIAQRMSPSQLRQLTRFAEFLMLEDDPDDLRDRGDVRARYASFKDVIQIDPAAIEAWAKQTGGALKSDK